MRVNLKYHKISWSFPRLTFLMMFAATLDAQLTPNSDPELLGEKEEV